MFNHGPKKNFEYVFGKSNYFIRSFLMSWTVRLPLYVEYLENSCGLELIEQESRIDVTTMGF